VGCAQERKFGEEASECNLVGSLRPLRKPSGYLFPKGWLKIASDVDGPILCSSLASERVEHPTFMLINYLGKQKLLQSANLSQRTCVFVHPRAESKLR
jgi:hypothetical protein